MDSAEKYNKKHKNESILNDSCILFLLQKYIVAIKNGKDQFVF